jgi:hypothetical protein
MRADSPRRERRASAFLPLPLCLHVGKRGVSTLLQGQLDALYEQIMDFAPLVEGDLPQRLISGVWKQNPTSRGMSERITRLLDWCCQFQIAAQSVD